MITEAQRTVTPHTPEDWLAFRATNPSDQPYAERTFIDLFAGAGCLSLGLMASGWRGLLAVEKDPMAFETLSHNLIKGAHGFTYQWPGWFPQEPCTVGKFASRYGQQLMQLRGKVTMIVGGPPCQGFSLAGRRNKTDARNSLFKAYIRVVDAVQPLLILLENVHGITVEFGKKRRSKSKKNVGRPPIPYSQRIARALEEAGYKVHAGPVRAADYGVPQFRPRYFLIAVRRGIAPKIETSEPFKALAALRQDFLLSKGLPTNRPMSVKEAISDLETIHGTIPCVDSQKFMQGVYSPPDTHYQRLMRGDLENSPPNSHRLANHRPETVARFAEILATCRRGVQLSGADRERLGLKKTCTVPLDPGQPSHTLTTLPDDIIHYSEARILTVREYARLQSVPDWFQFRGKYTTGGDRRVHECPRYTQAGNAVPPFLGEALGLVLARMHAPVVAPCGVSFESEETSLLGPIIARRRVMSSLTSYLKTIFTDGAEEVFADGMDSAFSRKLRAFIRTHGDLAIRAIDNELQDKEVNMEVAGEALRQIGSINDPRTYHSRLTLLLQDLESPDPRIRDAASLGIEALKMAEE